MTLKSLTGCGVCGRPLVYAPEPVSLKCALCGQEAKTLIYCPAGHYVCDACHRKDLLQVLTDVIASSSEPDPAAILEKVMAHPSVPMHGPEHHVIVPAVIIAAVKNAGYPVAGDAIPKAIERASKVPGGWCGYYGDCGAAVGVGVAVSILTKATPLTGKERSLALTATSLALARIADDFPRCCKRSSRVAIETAVDFLKEKLAISLAEAKQDTCAYHLKNKQCPQEKCWYYSK